MEPASQPNDDEEKRRRRQEKREKREKKRKEKEHESSTTNNETSSLYPQEQPARQPSDENRPKKKKRSKPPRTQTLNDVEILPIQQALPLDMPLREEPETIASAPLISPNDFFRNPTAEVPPPRADPIPPAEPLPPPQPRISQDGQPNPRQSQSNQNPRLSQDYKPRQSQDGRRSLDPQNPRLSQSDQPHAVGRRDRRAIRAAQAASANSNSVHERRKKEEEMLDRLGQDVKDQLANMKMYKPIFTYVTALAQVIILVCSLFPVLGGNTAKFAFKGTIESRVVPGFFNSITQEFARPVNMWYGPNDLGLLNYGAMYTPCMRDQDDTSAIRDAILAREENYGCCVHANGLCGMMNSTDCTDFSFKGVGVDCQVVPECQNDNIILHPCCFGQAGDCELLTEEHCAILRNGLYHPNKTLCSQVNCMEELCGMFGFYSSKPDQYYRVFTAIFMHAGVIHLSMNVLFQIRVVAELEQFCGPWRIALMYFLSGIGGNLIGSIFNPNALSAGSSGALYGMVGVITVDLFNTWQLLQDKFTQVLKLAIMLIFMLGIGTLHFIDNWAHCGGFFTGLLAGIAILPYINFGKWDGRRKKILRFISLGALVAGAVICALLFYEAVNPDFCSWCHYVNCIPYTKGFCDDNTV